MSDDPAIARRFARWATGLAFEDLGPEVVEKVKSLLLHHLVGAVIALENPRVLELVELVRSEAPRADGAGILGDDLGPRVARGEAVLANAEILNASRLNDSFRMITHPGPVLIAVAIVNAELEGRSPRDVITALACGYELHCRLADDFVPSVSARGFRPAGIFATVGAAMVAGRLMGLDEDGLVAAIGIAANSASGLNESRRDAASGGNENSLHLPNAARQGTFAATMARTGRIRGSEAAIEGPAGFLAAYAGSRAGRLSHAFEGPLTIDLASLTNGLGTDWTMRHVMFRIYPAGGFNQPVIELMRELREHHRLEPEAIETVTVTVNQLETAYPTPAFPRVADPFVATVGSIQYFLAHAAVNGGFPVIGGASLGPAGVRPDEDRRVLDFMASRVRLVASPDRPMFSPRIEVRMADGAVHAGGYAYSRLEWTFDELVERLQSCVPGLPGGRARLDDLVATVRRFEDLESHEPVFRAVRRKVPTQAPTRR